LPTLHRWAFPERALIPLRAPWRGCHIDDEAASRALEPVVGEQRSAEHQDVPVRLEIGEMLLSVGGADLAAVVSIFLIDDVERYGT
jgi:hypothetical protein